RQREERERTHENEDDGPAHCLPSSGWAWRREISWIAPWSGETTKRLPSGPVSMSVTIRKWREVAGISFLEGNSNLGDAIRLATP
ncbi:MAG TPA: hypothetical protein VGQ26_11335, partial [Streptosporangiaceae bacterium]|nr:hypothetical protein [Streptosporangiaceae bacterium]